MDKRRAKVATVCTVVIAGLVGAVIGLLILCAWIFHNHPSIGLCLLVIAAFAAGWTTAYLLEP